MAATFRAEVFQNQFLPEGAKEVHAIMTVTAEGAEGSSMRSVGGRLFGIICDRSGSMQGQKIHAAKEAMISLVNMLPVDAAFFIVTGAESARVVFPVSMANQENKWLAIAAIKSIDAIGGTSISTWLQEARKQFLTMPGAVREAVLLTDGQNDDQDEAALELALAASDGVFQCDCRGVGTDWKVAELKKISNRLLGTTDIIPDASLIQADFQAILTKAMSKDVSDVALRLWTPVGATVLFCKQVSPEIADLTRKAKPVKPQVVDYPTGAWAKSESRDIHFCIQVKPGQVGDEMLAGRASLIYTLNGVENKLAEARILAVWTDDDAKSTKIDRRVAHYTGQAELADSIQEGLDAKAKGDVERATALLGKAVKLAHDSHNEGTAKLLRTVVDVQDAETGTVRLKRAVSKEDEMALETRSTKTSRVSRS